MRRPLGLAAVCALALTGGTALGDMFKPSVQDQIKLGQKAAEQVRKEEKVLPDSDPRVKLVRRLGQQLVALIPKSERDKKPFQYTFDVIDSKDINAFALPGGPIFFYTGLLDNLTTEDQVAGVLGHELAHIRFEHWASAYADNQKRQLGLAVVLILLNANQTAFDIASVSDTLLFQLPYSRKNESDSDKSGFDIIVQSKMNPQGMVDVFTLLKEKGGSSRTAEWLNTHPDSDRRINNIKKRIAESGVTFPAQKKLSTAVLTRNYLNTRKSLPIVH